MDYPKLKASNLHYEILETKDDLVRIRVIETKAESDWIKKSELGITDNTNINTGSDEKEQDIVNFLQNEKFVQHTWDYIKQCIAVVYRKVLNANIQVGSRLFYTWTFQKNREILVEIIGQSQWHLYTRILLTGTSWQDMATGPDTASLQRALNRL